MCDRTVILVLLFVLKILMFIIVPGLFILFSDKLDKKHMNNIYYIETLDNLYEQTKESHKKQKKYFNSFDYGCTYNKNKCDYISKTLFNK